MNRSALLIITINLVLLSALANAQIIPFHNYTIQDGLPQNNVFDIIQDRRGYIWFATQMGISRFDGLEFKNLNASDGLADNYVNCIIEDREGNLWFGTDGGGVSKYDGFRFTTYNTDNGLVDNTIESFYEDRAGRIWCRTFYGISIIGPDSVQSYSIRNGLNHNNVRCLYEDSKGKMWVGTQSGLTIFDGHRIMNRKTEVVWSIIEDKEGMIWISTQGDGLFKFDGFTYEQYSSGHGLLDDNVLSIMEDSNGNIWCGTYFAGFAIFDGTSFTHHFHDSESPPVIMGFHEDSRGNIWIRTMENGVIRYDGSRFVQYDNTNNLVDNYVLNIFEDVNGNIWFGTLGGISKYGKGIFEIYNEDFGLPENQVSAVFVDSKGDVWTGNKLGLTRFDGEEFTTLRIDEDVPENGFFCLDEDQDGSLWAGSTGFLARVRNNQTTIYASEELKETTINDIQIGNNGMVWCATEMGLYYFKNRNFFNATAETILAGNPIRTILIDESRIWCGTTKGLYLLSLEDTSIRTFNPDNKLSTITCSDLMKDATGYIWLAADGGLFRISGNGSEEPFESEYYSTENGLQSNTLYLVEEDPTGTIWIGHEKGLNSLDPATGEINFYGNMDGFLPLETSKGAVDRDSQGHIWFGTVGGLVKYIPENNQINQDPPKTFLADITLFGKEADFTNYSDSLDIITGLPVNLILPYNRNFITFECIALHFTIPEKNLYRYKLEGFDREWTEPTSDPDYTFRKLPHGDFTLNVEACNSDGIWNSEPFTFQFKVKPPFWRTKWFYTLEVVIGIFAVFAFIQIRERHLIKEKHKLEEKMTERTQEFARQKEEIRKQKAKIVSQQVKIEEQQDLVTKQSDRIAQQNLVIKDTIYHARRIQSAVLPGDDRIRNLIPEHFILFKPRDIVSGDFYWINQIDHKLIVVAADCSGHGVQGAFMSMLGMIMLNHTVLNAKVTQAAEILNQLKRNIERTLSQTGKTEATNDRMDLALCVIDRTNMTLQFAGAYHPLILIRNGELIEQKGDRMSIGIPVRDESFTNHELDLKTGDRIYLFSDGYADQFGGESGRKFKLKPFKHLLVDIHAQSMSEQKKILESRFKNWIGNENQVDDILVIGIRI